MLHFISGHLCSGKSTIAKDFAEKTGRKFIEVSDIVREILQQHEREDLQGHPELDVEIIKQIGKLGNHTVVSGARQVSILEAFPNAKLVWVECSAETRYDRYKNRSDDKDLDKSIEAFDQAQARDIELGLSQVEKYMKNHSNSKILQA